MPPQDKLNERSPEKQAQNEVKMLEFLRDKVTIDNFDKLFDMDMAIEFATESNSSVKRTLDRAKKILSKYGEYEKMKNHTDPLLIEAELKNLQTPPKNMTQHDAEYLKRAFRVFAQMKSNAARLLQAEATLSSAHKAEYIQSKGIMDGIQEKLGDARKNWDKFSSGQKMAMAGVALFAGIWMAKSDNPIIQKMRQTFMTGVKVAGGAWLLNRAWFLFSGESMVDTITGGKSSQNKTTFLKDSFRTDENGAELMSKAFVQLGEISFIELLNQYQENPTYSEKGEIIEGTTLPPDEAYKAIHIFVSRFGGVMKLRRKYGNLNPPVSFSQVAVLEMSKDPNIKLEENMLNRTFNWVQRHWYDKIASSGPAVWIATEYEKRFRKTLSEEDYNEMIKKFNKIVRTENDVNNAIQKELLSGNSDIASRFVRINNNQGKTNTEYDLKYSNKSDGVYIIVNKTLGDIANQQSIESDFNACKKQAEDFLVKEMKVDKETVSKKITVYGSIFVADSHNIKYFVKYKKP